MNEQEKPVNKLQRLVLTRLDELGSVGEPMSVRAASRRSNGKISNDTLQRIANGDHTGRVTDRVAEGIAAALDVSVGKVYDAAGAPRPSGRWEMPEKYDRLTLEQRRVVEGMCDALLAADARGYERGVHDSQ